MSITPKSYRGVVAAGHDKTADAAAALLRAGGNAFDAACAALACACVAEPVLASLGGGGFLLAREASGAAVVYDFFAQTPRQRRRGEQDFHATCADFGTVVQEFHIGLGSIATPGMVRGLVAIHQEHGSVPLGEVLAPAIKLARDGVVTNGFQAELFQVVAPIYTTESAAGTFAVHSGPGGLPAAGDLMCLPALADNLEQLVLEGDRPFYEGEIAQALVANCQQAGGHLRTEDLASYEVVRREPLSLSYRDARVLTNPAPSFGGTLIAFALKLIEQIKLASGDLGQAHHLVTLVRAMVLTDKGRLDSGLGDKDALRRLVDPDFLQTYANEILGRPATARGTTHISVLDAAGNAASLSLSNGEGCGFVVPGTGIMPNNMLGEEDINPQGFNMWTEDCRIGSMMAPSLVAWPDGAVAALGSGGSNRIRSAILQV
ncbi:MAG: gamma-glutamyltransferase, partial [Alphaproteobacteria bacterium]